MSVQYLWNANVFIGTPESNLLWEQVMKESPSVVTVLKTAGATIPMREIKVDRNSSNTLRIVYFHANNTNALTSAERLECMIDMFKLFDDDLNVEIICPEYPGYHGIDKNVNPLRTVNKYDIDDWEVELSRHLETLPEAYTVFMGHSIGTGFATRTNTYCVKNSIQLLLLIAPITTLYDTAYKYATTLQRLGINLFFRDDYDYFDVREDLSIINYSSKEEKIILAEGSEDKVAGENIKQLERYCDVIEKFEGLGHNGIVSRPSLQKFADIIYQEYADCKSKRDKLRGVLPGEEQDKGSVNDTGSTTIIES
jgi:hypothetical protein